MKTLSNLFVFIMNEEKNVGRRWNENDVDSNRLM